MNIEKVLEDNLGDMVAVIVSNKDKTVIVKLKDYLKESNFMEDTFMVGLYPDTVVFFKKENVTEVGYDEDSVLHIEIVI